MTAAAMSPSPNTSPPPSELQVRGGHHAPLPAGIRDDLEQEPGPVDVDRQTARLVDDQQPGAAYRAQSRVGPVLVPRPPLPIHAEAPDRLHVAGITYGRMADGRFAYTASVTDMFARRIVGRACATTMNTEEPPLQALEQAIAWAASHGGTDGLARHGDHGVQYTGTVCAARVMEYGMLPSTGTVGDSYDDAMAESVDGAYRTELVWRRKPFHDPKDLGPVTFRWVWWRNSKRLHRSLGYGTPEAVETEYHTNQAAQAASL